ncbi:hypothetical protein CAP35_11975 [Chitinophagaceae bacterium IBVUCB1]|nr:hypothetical protein CAP35_11975 [Chitinophagaceae bacterium IBVUCB1]
MQFENKLRKLIIEAVGSSYLKKLTELNESDSMFRIIKVIVYYAAYFAMYFYAIKLPLPYFVILALGMWCVLVINFNRINVITHDASHYQIFNNKKMNDNIVNFLCAYTCLHDVQQYRKSHNVHHRSLHTDEDPDTEFYSLNVKKVLSDLLLITFAKQLLYNTSKVKKSVFVYLFQLIILSSFYMINDDVPAAILHYTIFFFYPMTGLFVLVIRIRTHIQHYSESNSTISRTTLPSFVEKLFIGQKMEYHMEHHLFPGIPYYNLIALHKKLSETLYKDAEFNSLITKTYFTDVH